MSSTNNIFTLRYLLHKMFGNFRNTSTISVSKVPNEKQLQFSQELIAIFTDLFAISVGNTRICEDIDAAH